MDSREVIRQIKADGWVLDRVKGSHHHFSHPRKPGIVTVKHPAKDFPMQYPVILTKEGTRTLATFPDCPGCQTFAEADEDIGELALDALSGWLESHLDHGEAPPRPSTKGRRLPADAKLAFVGVPAKIAVALSVRWARQDAGLTQAEVARRMRVSQQQAAKLERPGTNPTIETLSKFARALNLDWQVTLVRPGRVGRQRVLTRASTKARAVRPS